MRKLLFLAGLVLCASPVFAGGGGGAGPAYQSTPSALNMTAYQGGTWSSIGVTGTFWQATQPVSIASVPTHAVTQSGTWSNQITDGTTTANVAPGTGAQNGQAGLQVTGTNQTQAFTFSSASNGTSYDVSSYKSVSIQIVTNASVNTLTPQCSNDNSTWSGLGTQPVDLSSNSVPATTIATSATRLYQGGLPGKYFRLNCSTFVGGTTTGTIVFSTMPLPVFALGSILATQSGTWTMQPGNTPNTSPWLFQAKPATSGGNTPFWLDNLAGTVTSIKSAGGQLYNIQIDNTQTATACYIQIFNTATGSVTLGTTSPVLEYYVPGSSNRTIGYGDIGTAFGTAISIASTTTDKGATGSASGVIVSGSYD